MVFSTKKAIHKRIAFFINEDRKWCICYCFPYITIEAFASIFWFR